MMLQVRPHSNRRQPETLHRHWHRKSRLHDDTLVDRPGILPDSVVHISFLRVNSMKPLESVS
jgi:hypothetical protein